MAKKCFGGCGKAARKGSNYCGSPSCDRPDMIFRAAHKDMAGGTSGQNYSESSAQAESRSGMAESEDGAGDDEGDE